MTFNSMDYFVELARERSFTKAAHKLHITQQSLSSHIASLEQELGCLLFVRRVPLELTYAGTVFLRYALNFQQERDGLYREFCDITENQKGILRIGIAFTRGRAIMPRLILRFQEKYPNIEIELIEAVNRMLHKNLLDGKIDLAIANFQDNLPGVELMDFYSETIVLLIADSLFGRLYRSDMEETELQIEKGNLSVLGQCPFVLGNSGDIAGNIGRDAISSAGFSPIVKAKSDNIETLLALCVQGTGACFCPENLVKTALSPEQISTLRIYRLGADASYPIRFGYLKNSYQWSMISEFMRIAAEEYRSECSLDQAALPD